MDKVVMVMVALAFCGMVAYRQTLWVGVQYRRATFLANFLSIFSVFGMVLLGLWHLSSHRHTLGIAAFAVIGIAAWVWVWRLDQAQKDRAKKYRAEERAAEANR